MKNSLRLLIRADGNPYIGTGHLKREADLAIELIRNGKWRAWLVTLDSSVKAIEFFRVLTKGKVKIIRMEAASEFRRIVARLSPDLIVIDVMNWENELYQEVLEGSNLLSVVVSSWSSGKPCQSDLLVNSNPCELETKERYYKALGVRALLGLRYFMADPNLSKVALSRDVPKKKARNVLLALGGGDTRNSVGQLLEILVPLARKRNLHLHVLQSPVSKFVHNNIERFSKEPVDFLWRVESVIPLLCKADLLIGTHGNMGYESAVLGVPMIAVNLVDLQNQQAEEMARYGAVANAGLAHDLDAGEFSEVVEGVLDDYELRRRMWRRRRELVDGRGIYRIIKMIRQLL